jgi:hypothetical protein
VASFGDGIPYPPRSVQSPPAGDPHGVVITLPAELKSDPNSAVSDYYYIGPVYRSSDDISNVEAIRRNALLDLLEMVLRYDAYS